MTVSKIEPSKCDDKAIINLHYKKWSNILQRYMICSLSRKAAFDSAYRLFCEEVIQPIVDGSSEPKNLKTLLSKFFTFAKGKKMLMLLATRKFYLASFVFWRINL